MSFATDYAESYKDHRLRAVAVGDGYSMWRLSKAGTRNGSCVIMFTPQSVTVVGDWIPVEPATSTKVAVAGRRWFAQSHSPGYLTSKFLSSKWTGKEARRQIETGSRDWDSADCDQMKEYLDDYDDYDDIGFGFYEFCTQELGIESEDVPGVAICPEESAHLVAIHTAFLREALALGGFDAVEPSEPTTTPTPNTFSSMLRGFDGPIR